MNAYRAGGADVHKRGLGGSVQWGLGGGKTTLTKAPLKKKCSGIGSRASLRFEKVRQNIDNFR